MKPTTNTFVMARMIKNVQIKTVMNQLYNFNFNDLK